MRLKRVLLFISIYIYIHYLAAKIVIYKTAVDTAVPVYSFIPVKNPGRIFRYGGAAIGDWEAGARERIYRPENYNYTRDEKRHDSVGCRGIGNMTGKSSHKRRCGRPRQAEIRDRSRRTLRNTRREK